MSIGNLSSERVSKQEVFAVFSKFGRLAQISMKSAYGFVQYHTVAEAQAALEACQDMEFGGRRIRKLHPTNPARCGQKTFGLHSNISWSRI